MLAERGGEISVNPALLVLGEGAIRTHVGPNLEGATRNFDLEIGRCIAIGGWRSD